jgi:hypothetical protein
MSFTGDLEHLPIVDVMQLLHQTRKSGILRVKGRKGESQLVFKDGYMVCANHLNNSIRIGKILVDLNIITPEILDQALKMQSDSGDDRKPLIVTLIDQGLVNEEDAYKGLEHLIELAVVEILTWKKGTFTLEVMPTDAVDEYRFYPGKLTQEINVDTQSVLMDALRIFDEKMRDGELTEEEQEDDASAADSAAEDSLLLSADDLGLADLDQLEKKIPDVFMALPEHDPGKIHRLKIQEAAPDLPEAEREKLVAFLGKFSPAAPAPQGGQAQAVLFFSADELVKHALTTVCKHGGMPVFATNEEQDLAPIIAQSLGKNSLPILVFDAPEKAGGDFSAVRIASLRQQSKEAEPRICILQLVSPHDHAFALQSYAEGVRAVLPKPLREERAETFVDDTVRFLQALGAYLEGIAAEQRISPITRLKSAIDHLHGLNEASQVALVLLECVAGLFDRSLTLIVRGEELIAERAIGIGAGTEGKVTPSLGFRIPLAQASLLRKVVDEGALYYGKSDDAVVREHLFAAIGTPSRSNVLLLPMRSRGKTLFLTYADFGSKDISPVDSDLLEILASQAELVLDNVLYRKKLEKAGQ